MFNFKDTATLHTINTYTKISHNYDFSL